MGSRALYGEGTASTSSVRMTGLHVGTSPGLSNMVSGGAFVGGELGTVPAGQDNLTFFMWLEDGSSPVYYQEPVMNATDFLGTARLSMNGNADAGGLLAVGGAVLLNTVFECVGPESVISITLTIPIPQTPAGGT